MLRRNSKGMAESRTEIEDYNKDSRTPCKYGSSCYRTNKLHLEKFKHPPGTVKNDLGSSERPNKKQKTEDELCSSYSPSKNMKGENNLSSKETDVTKRNENSLSPKETVNLAMDTSSTDKNKHENNKYEATLKGKIYSPESKKLELKDNHVDVIKQLFLVDMPEDFYSFWEMCGTLNSSDPINALKDIKLKLVGPFDVLAGKVTELYEDDLPEFLRHWRFYYDPPEFQTVLAGMDSRCYHIGYYRDDPSEMPVFVARNVLNPKHPEKNGELKPLGPNLFAALNAYLEDLQTDPFLRMKVSKYQKLVINWAKKKDITLDKSSSQMEARKRKVVAKTFHGAGIVVPMDKKNDVGYRELAAPNSIIKKILKGIVESKSEEERKKFWEQLQPILTFANIANDECDFGTSLELGLDLFTYGSPLLHRSVLQLLTTSYNLLGRPQFASIIQAHLENRKEGNNLSIL